MLVNKNALLDERSFILEMTRASLEKGLQVNGILLDVIIELRLRPVRLLFFILHLQLHDMPISELIS